MDISQKDKDFEKAIADFGCIITKVCYYFSASPDEFNDLRQEVLYNIWKGWDSFQNNSKLSTWIYRVCFNTCVSFRRKEKIQDQNISIEQIIDIPLEEDEAAIERYNTMYRMIRKLKYEDRALLLMWLDKKTYDEIASFMGMNRNTVAVKLKRIKESLIKMNQDNY